MQNSLTYLDAYCERAGDPGIFAEPLNAATNLAFALAALWLAYRRQRLKQRWDKGDLGIGLLLASLFAIAIGSGAWHLFATRATMLADVVPIGLFIHVFLISFLRQGLSLRWQYVAGWWLVFLAVSIGSEFVLPRDLWNGSVMYLPAALALSALLFESLRRASPVATRLAAALAIFLFSVAFRSIDRLICPFVPAGTHFLWHLLNALVLALLVDALIDVRRSRYIRAS